MNCNVCNKPIEPGSAFCPGCGNKLVQNNQKMVKVVFHRAKRFTGCAVTFDVFIDNQPIGSLKNNGTLEVMLSVGAHHVIFDMWSATSPIDIMVPDCNTLNVEVALEMGLMTNKVVVLSTTAI